MPKEKKKKERENRRAKLVPSLALSIFGCVGLALLLVINGLFTEDTTVILNYLLLGSPFVGMIWAWLFSGVFLSTKLVEPSSTPRVLVENFLSMNSFVAVVVGGMLCMYRVMGFASWWWLIATVVLGGLCAVIHGWFLYFKRARNSIDAALAKQKEDKIFVKSLELEHGFFQSYYQQFTSVAAVVFAAAVIGYYLESEQISALSLINASLMVTWVIAGFFFGIFIPIQKHMEYIRHAIRKISLKNEKGIQATAQCN